MKGLCSVMDAQRTIYPSQRKMGIATKEVTSQLSLKRQSLQRLNLEKGISISWDLPEESYYEEDLTHDKEFRT